MPNNAYNVNNFVHLHTIYNQRKQVILFIIHKVYNKQIPTETIIVLNSAEYDQYLFSRAFHDITAP